MDDKTSELHNSSIAVLRVLIFMPAEPLRVA